jgi:diguanylate cyclase
MPDDPQGQHMEPTEKIRVRASSSEFEEPLSTGESNSSSRAESSVVDSRLIDLTSRKREQDGPAGFASTLAHERTDSQRVLLIEDDAAAALLVTQMLRGVRDFKFDLTHAVRAAEVTHLLSEGHRFDCVLLDLTLPDAKGLSGLTALRKAAPELPIVVLTGFDDKEVALQAVKQGAQDYLIKGSVDGELLSRSIRYAVERKRLQRELAHEALHDSLTGLPNRRLFLDRVASAFARLQRANGFVSMLFVDLDGFKAVNDAHGHETGDELLVTVAHLLKEAVRPSDTVGRFGGDEFTILCEGIEGKDEALAIAQRVTAILRRPLTIGGRNIEITASIGIVIDSNPEHYPQELIGYADKAMYEAKVKGKDRSVIFDESLAQRASNRVGLRRDLEEAIDRSRFELFFQPQVAIDNGRVAGVEALLRWDHPVRGRVEPQMFVDLAEESGLIGRLGSWALREATQRASTWRNRSSHVSTTVAVNISPKQLADPGLPTLVQTAILESGIDPHRLCLEITERAVIPDVPAAARVLNDLKALGVKLAIDDFGTGYSSLVYVKQLPVDILKIDRSFVKGLGQEIEDSAIVMAVINLAHTLGLTTVVEGVETQKQFEILRRYGCDYAQGTLFAPAVPEHELLGLLSTKVPIRPLFEAS